MLAYAQDIRPFVVGRKAWLLSGSPVGATASAGWYSIIETAKASSVEPYLYPRYILSRLPESDDPEDYRKLLPWNIAKDSFLDFDSGPLFSRIPSSNYRHLVCCLQQQLFFPPQPQLGRLLQGGGIKLLVTNSRLAAELKRHNAKVSRAAVFLTHVMSDELVEGRVERLQQSLSRAEGVGEVYSEWFSGQVKNIPGPFVDGVLEKAAAFAADLFEWVQSKS